MRRKAALLVIAVLIIPLVIIISSSSRLADNMVILIDFEGLGYDRPPMVMASISLPGVATLTPTSVEVKGGSVEVRMEGVRGELQRYAASGLRAGPSITLALIDYVNMSMRVKQIILTPLTLAVMQHGGGGNLASLRASVASDPLLPYYVGLSGTLNVRVGPEAVQVAGKYGAVGEVLVPRGVSDLVDTRPSYRVEGTFDDIIPIQGCVRYDPDNTLAYYDVSFQRAAYKEVDELSPFYGFLTNGSVPSFWTDHVISNPDGTWRALVSTAYAAVYYIEYRPWEDSDSVLESMLPGVAEYVRSALQAPNLIGEPPIRGAPERGYLVYGTMDYWLGFPSEDRWTDTKDLHGVDEVTAYNVPLLQVTYDTSQYTGNPNTLAVAAVVDVFSSHQSMTGFGLLGFYTSSVAIYRNNIQPGIANVPPGYTVYYYGDIVYSLKSDVGVLLFDVIGLGQDSCGEYWIIVEPIFIYYVDVVPLFDTIQVSTNLPESPSMVYIGDTRYQLYYYKVLNSSSYINEPHIIATWSKTQFYNSSYMFYIASPPGLDLILMLLSWTQGPPASYIINILSLIATIIYERANYTDVGVNMGVSISKTGQPPDVPVRIEWRVETLRYFLAYGSGEPLPMVGSRMVISLSDAQP